MRFPRAVRLTMKRSAASKLENLIDAKVLKSSINVSQRYVRACVCECMCV